MSGRITIDYDALLRWVRSVYLDRELTEFIGAVLDRDDVRLPEPPPPPEWYPKIRSLLSHVAQDAGFTGADLAELPAYVAGLRAKAEGVRPEPGPFATGAIVPPELRRVPVDCAGTCPCGVEPGDDDLIPYDAEADQ